MIRSAIYFTLSISIHALRVEGDKYNTAPSEQDEISIHALRVEGDWYHSRTGSERLIFLSTPSGWRATYAEV